MAWAPFGEPAAKAGARAFPLLIPLSEDAPGAAAGQRTLDGLREQAKPTLMLWAEDDPILTPSTGRRFAEVLGTDPPEMVPGASHFLQEDQGPLLGRRIADWLTSA